MNPKKCDFGAFFKIEENLSVYPINGYVDGLVFSILEHIYISYETCSHKMSDKSPGN